jgi:hypothetical protein
MVEVPLPGSGRAPPPGGGGGAVFSCAAALKPMKNRHNTAAAIYLCFIFFSFMKNHKTLKRPPEGGLGASSSWKC